MAEKESIADKLNKDPKLMKEFKKKPKEVLAKLGLNITAEQAKEIQQQLSKSSKSDLQDILSKAGDDWIPRV